MKHLMTLMALVVAVTAGAQTTWPYNPDSDNDGMVTVEDLFSLLSAFGSEWAMDVAPTEEYLQNSKSYYHLYDGTSSCCSINVPEDCRQLTLYGWLSSTSVQTQVPIRLPESGLFIGQTIEIRLTDVFTMSGSIEIQALVDGNWIAIGSLSDNPATSPQNQSSIPWSYLSHDLQNERFDWNGFQWSNVEQVINQLDWTPIN